MELSPSLISLTVSVDVKHYVLLQSEHTFHHPHGVNEVATKSERWPQSEHTFHHPHGVNELATKSER